MSASGDTQAAARPELADVIVLGAPKEVTQLSYWVPSAMAGHVLPGHRVLVPLRSRKVTAMVTRVRARTPDDPAVLKPLLEILESRPLLDEPHLKLLEFMASYYMAALSDVYRAVMPGAVRVHSRQELVIGETPSALREVAFSQDERAVFTTLRRRPMTARQLTRLHGEGAAAALRRLLGEGLIRQREAVRGRHRESSAIAVRLVPGREAESPKGKRQREILMSLAQAPGGQVMLTDLERASPGARVIARALARKGLVEMAECDARPSGPLAQPLILSVEQQAAFNAVSRVLNERRFETFLLWGVTASGKTEVYLQLAAQCLEQGRQVLVMLPEIALTDYLVQSFRSRFGALVAVAHSAQKISDRWAAWNAALSRHARILMGPRSALFAPIHDLGLIIVDEEHDPAYKQEEAIRYHARDMAVVLARHSSCPVVLGSATPSAESFANARSGRYRMLQMKRRINDRPMAPVEIVDLRREPRPEGEQRESAPAPVPLSAPLIAALKATLAAGGQSLVFINRRGYHNFLNCSLCGEVLSCPDCSVSMTFHLRDRSLRCHYCGHYRTAPSLCPACHGPSLQGQGFGTERLQAALSSLLPQARIDRMDSDTSRRQGARNAILTALARGDIDILVGTQMITKGFDFPGVTLVCVVLADLSLNLPDFRSAERTFQLLTQAAGRAGRGEEPGRVLIQTYAPHHYSIRAAERQDYARFMRREMELRRELGYPPFTRLAMVRLEGTDSAAVERIANAAAAAIGAADSAKLLAVLGPAPAPIEKIAQRYRWQIMIKAPGWSQLRDPLTAMRAHTLPRAEATGVSLSIDIDPVHML
jgi:primosomal protein N' (replication factor Y)